MEITHLEDFRPFPLFSGMGLSNSLLIISLQIFGLFQLLSNVYPGAFQTAEVMEQLIAFVKHKEDNICELPSYYP